MMRAYSTKGTGLSPARWIGLLAGCWWSATAVAEPVVIEDIAFIAQPALG